MEFCIEFEQSQDNAVKLEHEKKIIRTLKNIEQVLTQGDAKENQELAMKMLK